MDRMNDKEFERRLAEHRGRFAAEAYSLDAQETLKNLHLEYARHLAACDNLVDAVSHFRTVEECQKVVASYSTDSGEGLSAMAALYRMMAERALSYERLAERDSEYAREAYAIWETISKIPTVSVSGVLSLLRIAGSRGSRRDLASASGADEAMLAMAMTSVPLCRDLDNVRGHQVAEDATFGPHLGRSHRGLAGLTLEELAAKTWTYRTSRGARRSPSRYARGDVATPTEPAPIVIPRFLPRPALRPR